MSQYLPHYQCIEQLIQQGTDFVSVIVVDIKGSAPQVAGAKMLVTADCSNAPFDGTIGGGKLELFALKRAKEMLSGKTQANTDNITLNLQKDIAMTCGGVVQLFFESTRHANWNIAVFGAGHIAQALIPILLTLNCKLQCFDSRQEWLEKLPISPALKKIQLDDLSQAVEQLPKDSYVISVTHGHSEDIKICEKLLEDRTPPYLGIIGSKSKAVSIKKQLKALGIEAQQIEQIHCPAGLALGDNIPVEIAISIAAQLIQLRTE